MERIWLRSYPDNVPPEIDPDHYRSLIDVCDRACAEFGERPAFGNFGACLTFAELDTHARNFAGFLQGHCGLAPGDRVALMMPNILAYPVALLGALRAGGVVVNTNPQYTVRELHHQLADSGARIIVIFDRALATLDDALEGCAIEHVVTTQLGDLMPFPKADVLNWFSRRDAPPQVSPRIEPVLFKQALSLGQAEGFTAPEVGGDDIAFLQYTGGTTGVSKGAILTHRNLVANILQVHAWFGAVMEPGQEIIITALPLYHIYALTGNCFTFMSKGGMNYLITDPRDIRRFIKELRRVPFSAITGVNTLFNALLDHRYFSTLDFRHLKLASGGGMAVQRTVAERWYQTTGAVLAEGYGLTEASPVVALNRHDVAEFSGCIGLPLPSTECKIVDESGAELAVDEPGELCVRGPQVMRGYWHNAEETAKVLSDDGWLRTGDIALIRTDGYIKIVDRAKDMILVSGFNVFPNEIEDVVVAHPGVHEVAAIGVPDARSTEAVKLVVVRADPLVDEAALIAHCRQSLTAYKVPRMVEFVDELPKSNIGKILRRRVRELHGGDTSSA